ncbi:hypothetical protein [Pseudonocardia sp. GCM10023141]
MHRFGELGGGALAVLNQFVECIDQDDDRRLAELVAGMQQGPPR